MQVEDQWSQFQQRGKIHQKILEYRIPSLEAERLLGQSQKCIEQVSQSLAEGDYSETVWATLQVSANINSFYLIYLQ